MLCVSCKEHVVQPSYSPSHSSPVNSDDIFSLYPYVTPGDSVVFLLYANLVGFFFMSLPLMVPSEALPCYSCPGPVALLKEHHAGEGREKV